MDGLVLRDRSSACQWRAILSENNSVADLQKQHFPSKSYNSKKMS